MDKVPCAEFGTPQLAWDYQINAGIEVCRNNFPTHYFVYLLTLPKRFNSLFLVLFFFLNLQDLSLKGSSNFFAPPNMDFWQNMLPSRCHFSNSLPIKKHHLRKLCSKLTSSKTPLVHFHLDPMLLPLSIRFLLAVFSWSCLHGIFTWISNEDIEHSVSKSHLPSPE